MDLIIAGVDEVGRGPWAGPVIAAAVILPDDITGLDLRDSKTMTSAARARSNQHIRAHALCAFGAASPMEIDQINIRQATFLAMRRAVMALPQQIDHLDIDGRDVPPNLPAPATAIIKGDKTHPHIAAASIIAKELRDGMMTALAQRYPHYGWQNNAGYGTRAHREGIDRHGISIHHRRSFRPIREYEARNVND